MSDKTENSTALAIAQDVVGQVMSPADFTTLDGLIQQLGDKSAALTPEEKTAATSVIEEWNKSVTARIRANSDKAEYVLAFLDGKDMHGSNVDDIVEMFHAVIGDTPEYRAYVDAMSEYSRVQSDSPLDEPVTGDMTIAQAEKVQMDNRALRLEHGRRVQVAERACLRAIKDFIAAMNAMPETKAVRSKLQSYRRKANRMVIDCEDKATRAKLNLAISDAETRKILHDMMDFTKSI